MNKSIMLWGLIGFVIGLLVWESSARHYTVFGGWHIPSYVIMLLGLVTIAVGYAIPVEKKKEEEKDYDWLMSD